MHSTSRRMATSPEKVNSMAPEVAMTETFKGTIPFFLVEVLRVTLIVLFPALTLFLPKLLAG